MGAKGVTKDIWWSKRERYLEKKNAQKIIDFYGQACITLKAKMQRLR